MDTRTLRRNIRRERRAITPREARTAAQSVTRNLTTQLFFMRARRVAFYMASDGELDPSLLMFAAHLGGKQCFLPVMTDRLMRWQFPPLAFVSFNPAEDPLVMNRYGILEPALDLRQALRPEQLDIIFVPLVGFDRAGNRMGMGQGFYDRTLADLGRRFRRPRLIGLAYACQEVDALNANPWDVGLDAIVTEAGFIRAR